LCWFQIWSLELSKDVWKRVISKKWFLGKLVWHLLDIPVLNREPVIFGHFQRNHMSRLNQRLILRVFWPSNENILPNSFVRFWPFFKTLTEISRAKTQNFKKRYYDIFLFFHFVIIFQWCALIFLKKSKFNPAYCTVGRSLGDI